MTWEERENSLVRISPRVYEHMLARVLTTDEGARTAGARHLGLEVVDRAETLLVRNRRPVCRHPGPDRPGQHKVLKVQPELKDRRPVYANIRNIIINSVDYSRLT